MTDLNDSLQRMGFMQLAMLFSFLTTYVLAIGGMLHGRARLHSSAIAATSAVGFAGFTDPWVHGALLIVFVVAGLGLFAALSWLLAHFVVPAQAQRPAAVLAVQAGSEMANPPPAAGLASGVGELRWSAATGQSKPT
ncbi:MAG: hypothetical protein ABIR94_07435 [Rubrivivax sp.]